MLVRVLLLVPVAGEVELREKRHTEHRIGQEGQLHHLHPPYMSVTRFLCCCCYSALMLFTLTVTTAAAAPSPPIHRAYVSQRYTCKTQPGNEPVHRNPRLILFYKHFPQ